MVVSRSIARLECRGRVYPSTAEGSRHSPSRRQNRMPLSSGGRVTDLVGPVVGDEPVFRAIPLPNGARMAFTIQIALEAWSGATVTGSVLPAGAESVDWAT